jgi:uncharacterized protein YcaQ
MGIATMKLNTTESFVRALGHVLVDPIGAFARGHTAPIFRRLQS